MAIIAPRYICWYVSRSSKNTAGQITLNHQGDAIWIGISTVSSLLGEILQGKSSVTCDTHRVQSWWSLVTCDSNFSHGIEGKNKDV